jgi:hypothetical protein
LTPSQVHCVTVPDGPNGQWKGGEFERIEAKNQAPLKAHFAKLARDCLMQRHHPPVNIDGRDRFPGASEIDPSAILGAGGVIAQANRANEVHSRAAKARKRDLIAAPAPLTVDPPFVASRYNLREAA